MSIHIARKHPEPSQDDSISSKNVNAAEKNLEALFQTDPASTNIDGTVNSPVQAPLIHLRPNSSKHSKSTSSKNVSRTSSGASPKNLPSSPGEGHVCLSDHSNSNDHITRSSSQSNTSIHDGNQYRDDVSIRGDSKDDTIERIVLTDREKDNVSARSHDEQHKRVGSSNKNSHVDHNRSTKSIGAREDTVEPPGSAESYDLRCDFARDTSSPQAVILTDAQTKDEGINDSSDNKDDTSSHLGENQLKESFSNPIIPKNHESATDTNSPDRGKIHGNVDIQSRQKPIPEELRSDKEPSFDHPNAHDQNTEANNDAVKNANRTKEYQKVDDVSQKQAQEHQHEEQDLQQQKEKKQRSQQHHQQQPIVDNDDDDYDGNHDHDDDSNSAAADKSSGTYQDVDDEDDDATAHVNYDTENYDKDNDNDDDDDDDDNDDDEDVAAAAATVEVPKDDTDHHDKNDDDVDDNEDEYAYSHKKLLSQQSIPQVNETLTTAQSGTNANKQTHSVLHIDEKSSDAHEVIDSNPQTDLSDGGSSRYILTEKDHTSSPDVNMVEREASAIAMPSPHPTPTPAASPINAEERVQKLEERIAKLEGRHDVEDSISTAPELPFVNDSETDIVKGDGYTHHNTNHKPPSGTNTRKSSLRLQQPAGKIEVTRDAYGLNPDERSAVTRTPIAQGSFDDADVAMAEAAALREDIEELKLLRQRRLKAKKKWNLVNIAQSVPLPSISLSPDSMDAITSHKIIDHDVYDTSTSIKLPMIRNSTSRHEADRTPFAPRPPATRSPRHANSSSVGHDSRLPNIPRASRVATVSPMHRATTNKVDRINTRLTSRIPRRSNNVSRLPRLTQRHAAAYSTREKPFTRGTAKATHSRRSPTTPKSLRTSRPNRLDSKKTKITSPVKRYVWKPPPGFKQFDPTAYARKRKQRIEAATKLKPKYF